MGPVAVLTTLVMLFVLTPAAAAPIPAVKSAQCRPATCRVAATVRPCFALPRQPSRTFIDPELMLPDALDVRVDADRSFRKGLSPGESNCQREDNRHHQWPRRVWRCSSDSRTIPASIPRRIRTPGLLIMIPPIRNMMPFTIAADGVGTVCGA
jgi:hypothetical protein